MTLRDNEVVELLRDAPELLALADAVHETQRPPRRRAVPPLRVLALAAAVFGIVLAVLFVPDRAARHGVIGRALAAIGNARVLHLRTELPTGLVYIDLSSGKRSAAMYRSEVWYDQDTKRFHMLMEYRGKVADFVYPDDAKHGKATLEGGVDPAFTALATGYHDALANGDAKLERKGVLEGRPVYWLRFPPAAGASAGTEVAIDRVTYKPVLFRNQLPNGGTLDERVLVAETIGYSASDFRRRGPSIFSTTQSGGGYGIDYPPPRPVVKPPWLTAGRAVAGLRLSAVSTSTRTTRGRTLHGIVLVYGPLKRSPTLLTVEEFLKPDDPERWNATPHNAVAVQAGEEVLSGNEHVNQWTGTLVKDGVYVTIETTRGEKALLAVARALRRAR